MVNMKKKNKKRKLKKGVKRLLIVVIILLIAGFIVFWDINYKKGGAPEEETSSDSETQNTSISSKKDKTSSSGGTQTSKNPVLSGTDSANVSQEEADDTDVFIEPDMPILVNRDNKIPEDYKPDVVSIAAGYQLNKKAAAAWNAMKKAAAKDGVTLKPVSAYRSDASQTTLFNNRVKNRMAEGLTYEEAYEKVE